MAIENFEERFKSFKTVGTTSTNGFLETLDSFEKLCKSASIDTRLKGTELCQNIKAKLQSDEVKPFWKCLEKRSAHKEYYNDKGQLACKGKEILIVGAGPCGLRMAIECALLGASVTVVDMRQYISRNNVLHLWPFVIQDIKAIGGKVFNPKFCVGAIDHVSIKRLQLLLLKICLLVGVKVYTPVQFRRIIDPNLDTGTTWRVEVTPENHLVNKIDFDFIVGANGKNNSLPDFTRKTMRGKLAIAITANFVNNQTSEDARVTEIGGLSYIFDQEFFNGLKEKTGGDLENFVYFKDDTHYFVMTPKKTCLLKQGVIKQDFSDPKKLLSRENIDKERLHSFAREVVHVSTNNQLPTTKFAVNHHNEEDIAIFDFTAISMANHSCYVKEMHGQTLVQCIVGDSLLEPFWPTGTGCARGFLGVFDAAWFIRQWSVNAYTKMQIIAERETVFRLLSQTKPESSMSIINKYTIDPQTRYGTKLKVKTLVATRQVQHLYKRLSGTENKSHIKQDYNDGQIVKDKELVYEKDKPAVKQPESVDVNIDDLPIVQAATKDDDDSQGEIEQTTSLKRTRQGTLNSRQLLIWYQEKLEPLSSLVTVKDLNQSWVDGIALCALIETFRPTAISINQCLEDDVATRLQIAFILIEQEFGVSPMFSALEVSEKGEIDKLAMLSYLAQIRQALENEPISKVPKLSSVEQGQEEEEYDDFLMEVNGTPSSSSNKQEDELDPQRTSMSPHGMLVRVNQETAMQGLKRSVENAQVWMGGKKNAGTEDTEKTETMRRAILMSTNQMPSKLKSSVAKKGKLTRKKVLFKEPPPSVSKFRCRESQDIDIGGSGMPMNLNLSEEHSSPQAVQQEGANSEPNNGEEPKSMAMTACAATPVSARIANFQKHVAENQKGVIAKKQPGVQWKSERKFETPKEISSAKEIPQTIEAGSNICCICEKTLYLIERHAAHGKFFHKNCYRCTTCGTLLRLGNSLMKKLPDNKVEFYCFSHAYIAGVFDVEWKGKDADGKNESSTDDFLDDGATSNDNGEQGLNLGLSENMEDVMLDTREYQTSEEDESLDDDDFDALVAANTSLKSTKLRNQSMRSQKSLRLLVADEIQRGLDEVDADEEKLEKEGHAVEDKLRNRRSASADDEVMEEWLEVLRKKKELVDKESKLMLKKRLVELQDRQNRLQLLLTSLGMGANTDQGVHKEMMALEQDTEDLEMEMECLVVQMKSLSTYLDNESNV